MPGDQRQQFPQHAAEQQHQGAHQHGHHQGGDDLAKQVSVQRFQIICRAECLAAAARVGASITIARAGA